MLCVVRPLVVVFGLLCFAYVRGNDDDFRRIDAIQMEQPCLQAGGMCTIATDCPAGLLAEERGLCPEQRNQGVECCHGMSVKETRCRKHGGICRSDNCNPRLVFKNATDCLEGTKCCILV